MFEGVDGIPYISAQWFYRAKDTVRHLKCLFFFLLLFVLFLTSVEVIWLCGLFLLLFQVIQSCSNLIDDKRLFLSSIKDDNPLDCLLGKIKIVELPLNVWTTLVYAEVYYYLIIYMDNKCEMLVIYFRLVWIISWQHLRKPIITMTWCIMCLSPHLWTHNKVKLSVYWFQQLVIYQNLLLRCNANVLLEIMV